MQEKNVSSKSLWNQAITDARAKMVDGKLYVARLKGIIKTLEGKRDSGEAWPEEKKAGTAAESIPA